MFINSSTTESFRVALYRSGGFQLMLAKDRHKPHRRDAGLNSTNSPKSFALLFRDVLHCKLLHICMQFIRSHVPLSSCLFCLVCASDIVYLVSPNGCTFGAGKRDVHQAFVVQQLAEYSQQVALMIVPP